MRRRHKKLALASVTVPIVLLFVSASQTALAQIGPPAAAAARAETPKLTVHVGKSLVVRSPWPARRVAVTDPKIADMQVLTPRQVLLQGKKPGGTDLVMWSDKEEVWTAQVRVIVDIAALRKELRNLFPDTTLGIRESGDAIVLTGSLSRAAQAEQLHRFLEARQIKFVDMTDLAGVQQVMLKVRIAEVSRRAVRALGINALHTGSDFFGASTVGSATGGPLNPISMGVPAGTRARQGLPFEFTGDVAVSPSVTLFAGFPDIDLEIFLQALAENQYLRILAEPNLVALSGQEAEFLAGGEFAIPVVQSGGTAVGAGASISIEYREFGVRLRFRPIVMGDGTIQLYVAPQVSELTDVGSVVIQGFQVPGLIVRKAVTTVELKSRQTFAIAGLISRTTTATASRVPGLGDLPVLGALFRSVRYAHGDTELVVLVTASLVEPLSRQGPLPVPGMAHIPPDDWELYALGQIESKVTPKLAPVDVGSLVEKGLDRLVGPGAWARYEQRPAQSEAEMSPSRPAGTTEKQPQAQ